MLKLNVGLSKKIGEANYGSRGASVNLELECDSGLASDPERLRERIRHPFGVAKASVEEELASHAANCDATAAPGSSNGVHQTNGHGRDGARRATASQAPALLAVAKRLSLDATNVVQSRYGVDTPQDLSITEASELIDHLKSRGSGAGSRR
jgi:hypothetical protein